MDRDRALDASRPSAAGATGIAQPLPEGGLQLLAEAGETLAGSLDYLSTLQAVAATSVPRLGDWCFVDVVDADGGFQRRGVAHVDPAKADLAARLRRRYPPRPGMDLGVAYVMAHGVPHTIFPVTDDILVRMARDEDHLDVLRRLGPRSILVVPLVTRERIFGTLTVLRSHEARAYEREEVELATRLAHRAALAVDNALLYAEARRAGERAAFLAEASKELASSLAVEQTLQTVVRLAIPRIADMTGAYLLEESGHIRQAAVAHSAPAKERLIHELDALEPLHLDQDGLLAHVIRSGESQVVRDVPQTAGLAGSSSRREAILHLLGIQSFMAVPLRDHDGIQGALAFASAESRRRFSSEDLAFAQELARRVAVSLENARLYQRAQEASRLKDEFLATVGHELRTPLTAILGWARLLRNGRLTEEKRVRALDSIERSAETQARLVNDILDISRIVNGRLSMERKAMFLADAVTCALEAIRPAAEAKEVSLVFESGADRIALMGDRDRLRQVAWNLLSNALKFTPTGGQIRVRLESDGTNAQLSVEDSGEGIAEAFLPHVFDRFRQGDSSTTRSHQGLGLGLAIVRHLVEQHGGTVSASSGGTGRGAKFVVQLPIDPPLASVASADPAAHTDGSSSLSGVSVLVVDDQVEAREVIGATLAQAGATVAKASSAREARERLERDRPEVLVSDIAMPEEDGYSLVKRLRAIEEGSGEHLPAVALSAHARAADQEMALAAGFDRHLAKPVEPATLVSTVARLAHDAHR